MKNLIKLILGRIFIFIAKVLNVFVKFKFFHLYSTRLGHLTINFDGALLSVKDGTYIIFILDKPICNSYILSFFKKQKKTLFSNIFFSKILSCIILADPSSKLILKFNKVQPDFTFQFKYKSKIKFPYYSKEKLTAILSKHNVKENFIGIHARNHLYLKKNMINDPNYHGYRDFDFKDYLPTVEYLKNNYSLVKLGESYVEEDLEKFNEFFGTKIFTSFDFKSNKEIDYLINAYSKFNVIGNSGIDGISSILRKKIVYVNLIPFNLNRLSYCSPNSIIIPKKIFDEEKGRFLTFKENLNINFSIHSNEDPYKKKRLKVINNTPQEILHAVMEMEKKINEETNENAEEISDIFWRNLGKENKDKVDYLRNDLKLSISSQYLENNFSLINNE